MAQVEFGVWSTILLLGSLHGAAMAALLWRRERNRLANRCLAALLIAVVLLITPYTLGYAGFYDAFPWLTFAPFFWQLLFGPLLWLYVRQLARVELPRRWTWHLLPAALQGGYYTVLFLQPLPVKWQFNDDWHVPLLLPLLTIGGYLSLAGYLLLAWREFRGYQAWLEHNSAAREELRLYWLRGFMLAMALITALMLTFTVVDRWWRPLDYFDEFPLYLALVGLVYYLGLEGWRHADQVYPRRDAPSELATDLAVAKTVVAAEVVSDHAPGRAGQREQATSTAAAPATRDWRALGERYRARLVAAGWWREPDLSLVDLARRLGTNTQYLSRALNEGLGQSFSECVNRQRVIAAQARLSADSEEVLAIALAVGFGSKASFNRAFRAYVGVTPSDYREVARRRS